MSKWRTKLAVAAMISFTGMAVAVYAADSTSPWVDSGQPTISKTLDLPPNTLPASSNSDCLAVTIRSVGESTMHDDCVTETAQGQVGSTGIIFNGMTEMISVVPPAPFFGLNPIPGQAMLVTHNSATPLGLYMHFYRSIQDKLKPNFDVINGVTQYTLTRGPDFTLRDSNGAALPINPYALAYSPNGSWMVVDSPNRGFLRVNLATFEIVPFAPSMNQPGDFSDHKAQLTIGNDGRYVAIKNDSDNTLVLYDVQSCVGAVIPVSPTNPKCRSRNYTDDVVTRLPGFRTLYQPRFVNDFQLSFTAIYDFVSGANFKVAQYVLTAPGQSDLGIEYLGMGDSFAAGQGAFNYLQGTDTDNNACHLSSRSYPLLASASLFVSGHSVACSGAKTRDILELSDNYEGQVKDGLIKLKRGDSVNTILANYTPGFLVQTDFVTQYKPQAITLSVGGNDVGFADIVKSCVSSGLRVQSCWNSYEDRQELTKRINAIYNKLKSTYKLVKKPGKRVYVVGYPHIVTEGNCGNNVHLNAQEVKLAESITDQLNAVIKQAADSVGVFYVDVSQALAGHRLCETGSDQMAVNGLTLGNDGGIGSIKVIGGESYHPNALGQELLNRIVLAKTSNLTAPMPTPKALAPPVDIPPDPSLLHSNRAINLTIFDDKITSDVLIAGQPNQVTTTSTETLKAQTAYSLKLESSAGLQVGARITDPLGNLTATIIVPPGTAPGFYTIHIYGPNLGGQMMDVFKTVYIGASPDDYNGDGVPNGNDPCIYIPPSGQDTDRDNIDDACDPIIANPSTAITAQVRLTDNSIHVSRP